MEKNIREKGVHRGVMKFMVLLVMAIDLAGSFSVPAMARARPCETISKKLEVTG